MKILVERDVFFYWCPTDNAVEVIVHMNKEMLEKLTFSYNKIIESGVENFECVKLVDEILTEANRGINENIS
jgi:hypothetical protein